MLFDLVWDLKQRRANNKLFKLLAKEGKFADLWQACLAINFVWVENAGDKLKEKCWISLFCFQGKLIKTISWKHLATTIGSLLNNSRFSSSNPENGLAEVLARFYCFRWNFLKEQFAKKAGERHPTRYVAENLARFFDQERERILAQEKVSETWREEQALAARVRRLLERTHGVTEKQILEIKETENQLLA